MTVDPEGWLHFSNVTRDDNLDSNLFYGCAAYNTFRDEYKIGNRVKLLVQTAGSMKEIFLYYFYIIYYYIITIFFILYYLKFLNIF